MLKLRGYAIALGFLIASVFWTEVVWGQSSVQPTFPQTISERAKGSQGRAAPIALPESPEERIADYTWWLGAFTLVLAVVSAVQSCFLIRADKTARIAADAARRSADAAIGVELPFIRMDAPELIKVDGIDDKSGGIAWDVDHPGLPEFSRIYEVDFRNSGRTTASPTHLKFGFKVTAAPHGQPIYTWSMRCDQGSIILPGNDPITLECAGFCIVLSEEDRVAIKNNTAALWVFASLSYLDFLDQTQVRRFCWRWGCPDAVGLYYFFVDENTPSQYTGNN